MKAINLFMIYVLSLMLFFFVLSFIGLLWEHSYTAIISNTDWFICYITLFGWWMAIFPAREYYLKNQEYMKEIFG